MLNFANCTPEEVTLQAEEAERIITAQRENSVLVLADFAGAQFSRDAATRIKEVATHDRPFVKRVAWVQDASSYHDHRCVVVQGRGCWERTHIFKDSFRGSLRLQEVLREPLDHGACKEYGLANVANVDAQEWGKTDGF